MHKRWLSNMYGAFLTLLDKENRILFFAAGALRRKVSKTTDEVVILTLNDLACGITGSGNSSAEAYQPEFNIIELTGAEKHRDFPLEIQECPLLSMVLGLQIPEAASWGILRVGPARDKMMNGFAPNGTNAELFLEPSSWKEAAESGAVPGSGSNDLIARLAPRALEIAEQLPSAWTLAVSAAYLFGGMSVIPKATPIRSSVVVRDMIEAENSTRRAKKAEIEAARAARRAAERGVTQVEQHMNVLRQAVSPDTIAAMEKTTGS